MSRAKQFLNESEDVEKAGVANSAKRIRHLTQFLIKGNVRRPTITTKPTLEAGVYKVGTDFNGVFFGIHEVNTDELLRFEDPRSTAILEEVNKFWELKPKFKKLGFTNKRGMLLHGLPGTGKSCLIKLMMEDMVKDGNVVFITKSPWSLTEVLHEFREVEPERKALVVLEEVDEMSYQPLSDLFDGDEQIGDVLFVCTTNHIERIHPKMLREGRLDRKIEIPPPPKAGRLEYLKAKLGMFEKEDQIEEHADLTDGFTFGQLREFLIGVYCYDKPAVTVAERIKNGGGLDECKNKFYTENEIQNILMHRFGIKKEEEEKVDESLNESNTSKKKSRAALFLEDSTPKYSNIPGPPFDAESVVHAFQNRLKYFNIEGVKVAEVEVDFEGDVIVHFSDHDGDEMGLLFTVDPDEGVEALVLDDDDHEEGDATIIDLDPLTPPVIESPFGTYVNLTDLSWLNKSTLMSIFLAGDIGDDDSVDLVRRNIEVDAYGHKLSVPAESKDKDKGVEIEREDIEEDGEIVESGFKVVVRGGKRIRLPIVRRKRKRRLTARQLAGVRKGALKRKQKKAQTSRKLKKSLKVRKRAGIKKQALKPGQRVSVAGAA